MDLEDFIATFAEQFDDTDSADIQAGTEFQTLDEWSSLTAMAVIAMVRTKYNKTVSGKEIRDCKTVEALFNLVAGK